MSQSACIHLDEDEVVKADVRYNESYFRKYAVIRIQQKGSEVDIFLSPEQAKQVVADLSLAVQD